MKKSAFILLAILCILLSFTQVALADAIIVPENDFFEDHREHIIYLGRNFVVNSESGSVSVRAYPEAIEDISTLKNGDIVYIQYSCLYDGSFWGFIFSQQASPFTDGWVMLSDFLVLYDYVAFEEDHIDELYPHTGDLTTIRDIGAMHLWPWPGSAAPMWTVEGVNVDSLIISHAFMDEYGNEWGFLRYAYGGSNVWVNISDPLNRDLPVFNPTPAPMPWVSDTEHIDIATLGNQIIVLITGLVAALVVITAILIRIVWNPKTKDRSDLK